MILAGALLNTDEKRVVFADQRIEHWAIIFRQLRDDLGKFGVAFEGEFLGEFPLALRAGFARALDYNALLLDGGDGLQDAIGLAAHDQVLLLVEAGDLLIQEGDLDVVLSVGS